jgi:hypothetical protein
MSAASNWAKHSRVLDMTKTNSRPTFKPKPFMDGSGWHVDAEWPDGLIQHVDDFGSDSEAREWIAKKSQAWLQKHFDTQAE